MKEVKTPRKPLAIYYAIVLLMLLLLNFVLLPWMEERQVKEVDYGTFMTMTEEKNIGRVDIESNQIIFTDKDETQVYKTGLMNDTGRSCRTQKRKPYVITLIPALFMTAVCSTYILIAREGLHLPQELAYWLGGAVTLFIFVLFLVWRNKYLRRNPTI